MLTCLQRRQLQAVWVLPAARGRGLLDPSSSGALKHIEARASHSSPTILNDVKPAKRVSGSLGSTSAKRARPRIGTGGDEWAGADEAATSLGPARRIAERVESDAAAAGGGSSRHVVHVHGSERNMSASGVKLVKKPGVFKSYHKLVSTDAGQGAQAQQAVVQRLVERQGLGSSSDQDMIADDPSVAGPACLLCLLAPALVQTCVSGARGGLGERMKLRANKALRCS